MGHDPCARLEPSGWFEERPPTPQGKFPLEDRGAFYPRPSLRVGLRKPPRALLDLKLARRGVPASRPGGPGLSWDFSPGIARPRPRPHVWKRARTLAENSTTFTLLATGAKCYLSNGCSCASLHPLIAPIEKPGRSFFCQCQAVIFRLFFKALFPPIFPPIHFQRSIVFEQRYSMCMSFGQKKRLFLRRFFGIT